MVEGRVLALQDPEEDRRYKHLHLGLQIILKLITTINRKENDNPYTTGHMTAKDVIEGGERGGRRWHTKNTITSRS